MEEGSEDSVTTDIHRYWQVGFINFRSSHFRKNTQNSSVGGLSLISEAPTNTTFHDLVVPEVRDVWVLTPQAYSVRSYMRLYHYSQQDGFLVELEIHT